MEDRKERDAEKRKQADNDVVSGRQKKAREDNGEETAATEDEVEEFFAILRRIHVAVNYFKKRDGDVRELQEREKGWRAMHGRESNGVKGEAKREEGVEENVGFDLNASPDPDENPI